MASAAPPPQYASSLDEHVHGMVHSVLASHNEWATQSHLAWLQRMYTRVLLRTLELDRREMDLARREAAFARGPKKSRRGKNQHGEASQPSGPGGEGGSGGGVGGGAAATSSFHPSSSSTFPCGGGGGGCTATVDTGGDTQGSDACTD